MSTGNCDEILFSLAGFDLPEKDIIWTTLSFLSLQNANKVIALNPTEQLLYTMIAFLGKDCAFLEPATNTLLAKFISDTFKSQEDLDFNSDFNGKSNNEHIGCNINSLVFAGKINFENLYIALLDQFQGTSYSDKTFSLLIMAPLAQKHNIKWRHIVWSEHVHALRFVTCNEHELIGCFDDYLSPGETDSVLLKSYYQAIHSGYLLPDSVAYKIASHHVTIHKDKVNHKKNQQIIIK